MQQLGHEVGAGRRDEDGVRLAAEVDVRHVVGLARIPLRVIDRAVGQGLHGDRRDELARGLGHHHLHGRARLDQGAAKLGRLVAGDAPGQPQDDVFSGEIVHGGEFSVGRWTLCGPHAQGPTTNPQPL